ncbi:MAG: hypothetical protein CVU80_00395 [Elusimicrobia bacterium HGW-Elusimicrobia-4]|nr:MAG: hypothetical protein CVU80_00395 [Elusimicrobia bacterium HGW-Elusimicrobia-4]
MKFIRWKAVLPTVIILAVAIIFTVFFADRIIKKIAINIGESVFSAKVEISFLKTKLKNMSVEIKGLQIASKEDVWKNILVIDRISFSMEPLPLLSKKIIVNEMTSEGMKWGTVRKTSGALPPKKKKKLERKRKGEEAGISDRMMASLKNKVSEETSNLAIISDIKSFQKNIKDIDVKKLTDIANLSSLKEIEKIKSSFGEKETKYRNLIGEINVDAKTKEITDTVDGMKELKISSLADVPSVKEKISKLKDTKKSTEKLLEQIKIAKNNVTSDFGEEKDLVEKINELKNSDYNNIMSKLSIGNLSAGNITKSLIGPIWLTKINGTLYYVKLARKYMPKSEKKKLLKKRLKGMDVAFEKENELPGVLVKNIVISGTTGGEGKNNETAIDFKGNVSDITSNPVLWGKPTTGKIIGKKRKKEILINLIFDHTKKTSKDEIMLTLKGMTPTDIGVSNLGNILFIDDGDVGIIAKFEMAGDELNSQIASKVGNVKFGTAEKENETQKIFKQMFKNVKELTVDAQLISKQEDTDFKVKSNLDDIFKQGIKSLVGEKLAEAKAKIKEEIDRQVDGKKKETLAEFTNKKDGLLKNLTSKEQVLTAKTEEIKIKISSAEEEIKKQGQQKIQKEIKDTFKK